MALAARYGWRDWRATSTLLLEHAVNLRRGDLASLSEAARAHRVTVVCGVHERDDEFGGGTLYNTVLVIGPEGASSIDTES